VHEAYDNAWTRVRVPEPFLQSVYPQAEGIVTNIEGERELVPHVDFVAHYTFSRSQEFDGCHQVLAHGH
jgi:hypothetical protein